MKNWLKSIWKWIHVPNTTWVQLQEEVASSRSLGCWESGAAVRIRILRHVDSFWFSSAVDLELRVLRLFNRLVAAGVDQDTAAAAVFGVVACAIRSGGEPAAVLCGVTDALPFECNRGYTNPIRADSYRHLAEYLPGIHNARSFPHNDPPSSTAVLAWLVMEGKFQRIVP